MNRPQAPFGDDGLAPGQPVRQGRLRAYAARHRFEGHVWGITVWARDETEALWRCGLQGMVLDGEISDVFE